jgi:hypothetical protein
MSSATSPLWKTFRADRDHRSGHPDRPSDDHAQLIGIVLELAIAISPESRSPSRRNDDRLRTGTLIGIARNPQAFGPCSYGPSHSQEVVEIGLHGKTRLSRNDGRDSSGGIATPLTQKVTLIIWPTWRRTAVLWGAQWNWDAVTNGDGVVTHQDVFHHESYNSLALRDIKRLSSTAQACEERRERCCSFMTRRG